MKNKFKQKKFAFFAAIALCMAVILPLSGCARGDLFGSSSGTLPAPDDPGHGSSPPHFYLGGNLYTYSGRYAQTLPEGFEFVKEVANDRLSLGDPEVDFSGNFDGEIYMSESDKTKAYVKMRSGEVYLRFPMRNIHFYVDGNLYYLNYAAYVYILPDGFELAGKVQPSGEPAADFTGNAAGYIYTSESDKSAAYFRFENWDKSADGKEQYFKCELRN